MLISISFNYGYTKRKPRPHGVCRAKHTAKVRQFAKANYKNFIEINFEQMPLARLAFDGNS